MATLYMPPVKTHAQRDREEVLKHLPGRCTYRGVSYKCTGPGYWAYCTDSSIK